ncbi:oligosaccharide flippase family protein [Anoxybacillus sp. PDR2]|jgi:polysaccharide transporter, PST family|uniref:putative polysaccharide biosynthesis protein n=1 Tax=Anoxybacillus sp. PDR2 TaxID=1636720 RepID=UPI0013186BBB|nr:polysaccharide biosynthesis protein [Anoxybacillus sp. PDR2]QHC02627.1 oligosaccharide flippase family protein [Anoxybacillus sp. PDR2]
MAINGESRNASIWRGATVLAIAAVVMKILSAFYRIPYQNIVGDIGFYIYQQVYPIYAMVIALATYGYPVVISKLVAEQAEEKNEAGIRYVLQVSFWFLAVMGLLCFGVLYVGGGWIARWMGDEKLTPLIRTISFSFLLLPFLSVLRGYFQGKNEMMPTALSQVAEQSVRVATIIICSYLLVKTGHTMYEAGTGAIFGSLTGGFAALLLLSAYWLRSARSLYFYEASRLSAQSVIRYLFVQGLTICIANMALTLTQLADAMSLLSLLMEKGIEEQAAKAFKGVYDRGQPLVQLGTVVATSFSLTLVPLIAGAKKRGDETFILEKIDVTLRVALVVGIGAAFGLAALIRPVNIMLFKNDAGSWPLAILSLSIFFTTMSLTASALLQGIGYEQFAVIGVLIAFISKWLGNLWFVPMFGIAGASWATWLSYIVMFLFLYQVLRKKIGVWFIRKKDVYAVMKAALIMVVSLKLYMWGTQLWGGSRLGATGQALLGVLLGGSVYIIMILRGKLFSPKEIALFPFGEKLRIFLGKIGDEK